MSSFRKRESADSTRPFHRTSSTWPIHTADGVPRTRVRLTASLAPDGVIDEKIEYVLEADEAGEPTRRADMTRYDRGHIEVHYLPARRDPADHISYTTASLKGVALRTGQVGVGNQGRDSGFQR
jgi:hypothetical protein